MRAAVAGYDIGLGYIFKCPLCGTILSCRSSICPNCQTDIDDYTVDAFGSDYPKVCLDFHGVAFDMLAALKVYLKATYDVDFDPDKVTDYDFRCDLGFDSQLVFEAFNDPELYALLEPYEGVKEAVKLLNFHCFVHAYTGVVNQPKIIARTSAQIRQLGLMGDVMPYKKPTIYDANVLIDDSPAIHRQWWMSGFPGLQYIIDRPYNQPTYQDPAMWDSLIRVPSLYDAVLDMYKRFGWPVPEVRNYDESV